MLFTFSSYVLDVGFVNVFQSNFDSIRNMQIRCNCQRQTPIRFCEWEREKGILDDGLWTTNLKATHKTLVNLSFVTRRCLIVIRRFRLSTVAVAGEAFQWSFCSKISANRRFESLLLWPGFGIKSFITRFWFELQESSVEQKNSRANKSSKCLCGNLQIFLLLASFSIDLIFAWENVLRRY